MTKTLKYLSMILAALLLFAGCSKDDSTNIPAAENGTAEAVTPDFAKTQEEMFSDRDFEIGYDEENAVRITFDGATVTATSDSVNISETTATITAEATYILTGDLTDGQLIVDAPENAKLQIVLDNVTMHSSSSAPIYIKQADKVFLTLAKGSQNTLSSGDSFTAIDDSNIDGTIFSKQDLTVNGEGALAVTSPAGHGIVCKDDLVFTSGSYTVTSASHGLDANDSVRIANASITIDAGKDGIHAENDEDTELGFVYFASGTMTVSAEGDGISASAYMQIDSGSFDIVSGGGSVNAEKSTSDSYGGFMGGGRPGMSSSSSSDTDSGESIKGLKAQNGLLISDGKFTINSADDSVHSNTDLTVNGGSFDISAGDDAFHADETLTITAGKISISESYEGLEALHVKVLGGEITLVASDDGINAAGGNDSSGFGGGRGDVFGRPGAMGGSSSSNGSIVISGGTLDITASGDGLDANGTLTISGGYVTVCGPNQGDTATLDYDTSGSITGGTFIGTGASGMAQSFSAAEQGVISVSVGNVTADTQITLTDKDGNVIVTHTPSLAYSVVIISSPAMESGEKYTLTVGNASEEIKAS